MLNWRFGLMALSFVMLFIGVGGAIGPVLGGLEFGSYHYLRLMNIMVLSVIALAFLTLKKGKQYVPDNSNL